MKTVAFTDLHGNYKLWNKIKNYYKDDDTLIFLGDACDRGKDGIKIIQELLKDKRVIYLLGNHEQMLLSYYKQGIPESLISEKELIKYNGCLDTLNDFCKLDSQEKQELITGLKNCNNFFIYINKEKKNIFLSHSGTNFEEMSNTHSSNLLWNRDHIKNKTFNNKYKHWYMVHGHTPVQVLFPKKLVPEIYRYCSNHKIDLDMGTAVSNKVAVLDLDTLQVKYFIEENKND